MQRAANIQRALGLVQNRFDTRVVRYPVGRFNIDLCQVSDPARLAIELCSKGEVNNDHVPYWAQIWPVSIALARFISRLKALGLSLAEIAELNAVYAIGGSTAAMLERLRDLLGAHLEDVDQRISELGDLRSELARYGQRIEERFANAAKDEAPGEAAAGIESASRVVEGRRG